MHKLPSITPENATIARSDDQTTGLALLEAGGTGSQAGNKNQQMLDREPCPLPVARMQFEMDKNEMSTAQERIIISLSPENAAELVSNAPRFGKEAVQAIESLASMLDAAELTAGARTTPGLTQLALVFHQEKLLAGMRRLMNRILKHRQVKAIRPVIVASNGGGTGNAASRLIPWLLGQEDFKHRLLAGLPPFVLESPIVITAYPFTYARSASTTRQEIKIMSNQYAWLREMDVLMSRNLVSNVLSVGYSNSAGTILDSAGRMVDVLASSLHHFIRNYSYFMSRWTDSVPNPQTDRYLGSDLPEHRYPSVRKLITRFYGSEN